MPATEDEMKRALKAFKKRLKLLQLEEDSKLGHSPLTGSKSQISAIRPPSGFGREIWEELAGKGLPKEVGSGNPARALLPLLIAAAGGGAFFFTRHKSMTHASYQRACELAQMLGMNERGMAKLREVYEGAASGFPVGAGPEAQAVPFARIAKAPAAQQQDLGSIPLQPLEG